MEVRKKSQYHSSHTENIKHANMLVANMLVQQWANCIKPLLSACLEGHIKLTVSRNLKNGYIIMLITGLYRVFLLMSH